MKSLKGHLLIAAPTLLTPFFTRTVILMIEHGPGGAMGVVLNRPTDATVEAISEELLEETLDWDKPILLGGPVSGPLMAIHSDPIWSDSEVFPGLYATVEIEKLRELLRIRCEPSLVIANYSGWSPGQLEGEFGEDSWITLPAQLDHVFRGPEDPDLWQVVVKQAGTRKLSEFLGIKDLPADPSLN